MNGACPKCGHEQAPGEQSCGRCGVIFARIHAGPPPAALEPAADDNQPADSHVAGRVDETASLPLIVVKGLFLLALGVYGLKLAIPPIASNAAGESFLHLVNLPFHEAGHVLFTPFGRFMQILGGSLMQLIIPAIVAGTFFYQSRFYSGAVGLWWLGESFLDLAPYIDDARAGQLMLLGGVTGSEVEDYHDWEGLLSRLGMMQYDHALARVSMALGVIIMLGAVCWGGWLLWREYAMQRS